MQPTQRNVTGVTAETLTVNSIPVYLGWAKFVTKAIGENRKCMQEHATACAASPKVTKYLHMKHDRHE